MKPYPEKNTYNLRSAETRGRKIFREKRRIRRKCLFGKESKLIKIKKDNLAPIIEEIKTREVNKLNKAVVIKGGSEINKIAEKLTKLIKESENINLDKELLFCKESFESENIERPESDHNDEGMLYS